VVEEYFAPAGSPLSADAAATGIGSGYDACPSRRTRRVRLAVSALVAATAGWHVLGVLGGMPAGTAVSGTVHAVEGTAPAADGWRPLYVDGAGRPARLDPCRPVHVVANFDLAPPQARADLHVALAEISRASGLRLVYDGETTELPGVDRPTASGTRWAPVLVAWVRGDGTPGEVGPDAYGVTRTLAVAHGGRASIVTAQIAINAEAGLRPGFGAGQTTGEVLLHELGHAVGLGHVSDPGQVMNPTATNFPARFGSGDLAGLAAVGRPAGCQPLPPPSRPLPWQN